MKAQGMEGSRTTKIEQSATESLPREIVLDIMSRLPTESLHNIKLVCKSWLNLAKDPVLVDLHFTRLAANSHCLILHCDTTQKQLLALHFYSHKDNVGIVKQIRVPAEILDFDVIGSCKGWLCLCDSLHKSTFHVYNPLTSDCIELPKSIENSGDQWPLLGFGFHSATKEYKVVKIVTFTMTGRDFPVWNRRFNIRVEAHILTLGSPTWRNLGAIAYHPLPWQTQVLVNGRLHWVSWPHGYRPGRMLISFDLADEQFRELPKPDSAELERRDYKLVVLGGCLSAAFHCNDALFEVWIMKEYGVKESWIKGFRIGTYMPKGLEQAVDPSFKIQSFIGMGLSSKFYVVSKTAIFLCGLKNGEILLQYKCRALVSYDPKSETFRDITVQGMPNWFEAVVHNGSHDSINALTAESF